MSSPSRGLQLYGQEHFPAGAPQRSEKLMLGDVNSSLILITCMREGLATDMNVYDAAALSAVVHLSEQPVARKSAAVDFPDFTRGAWRTNPPLGILRA